MMDLNFVQTVLQSPALTQAIDNILLAVITGVVGLLSKTIYTWFKTHLSAKQFALLQEVVADAVQASEQGAIGGFVTDKKVAALKYATDYLDKLGLKYTPEQLSSAVEAAVLREFNSAGQPDTTTIDTTSAPVIPETPTVTTTVTTSDTVTVNPDTIPSVDSN